MSKPASGPRTASADMHWTDFVSVLGDVASRVVFDNDSVDSNLARAEGLRYMARLLAAGIEAEINTHDAAYPEFTRLFTTGLNWGIPNPDTVYRYAPVCGDYDYRITTSIGNARDYQWEVHAGDIGTFSASYTVSSSTALEAEPDGTAIIVLSRQEQQGNWLQLPEAGGFVVLRELFYDWENGQPAVLAMERVGATYPPARLHPAELIAGLERLRVHHQEVGMAGVAIAQRYYQVNPAEVLFTPGFQGGKTQDVGVQDQYYGFGHFRCDEDSAVVLEFEPPECRYWSVHLGSRFWETVEWDLRQSSLNGHQAVVDDDGVFRAVISQRDPGVPNWLDPGGRETGLVCGRYLYPKSAPNARLSTVPFDSLREQLPSATASVTPSQRDTLLRRRLAGFRRLHRNP
jgi:hypothetical protein